MKSADIRNGNWSYVLDAHTRILVADDDPILREFAAVYLATPSTTIDTAEDGAAAWARLMIGDYDVVLVDIEMPRLDGFMLVERIRCEPRLRHMPVIMLTGHEDIASIDRAYQVGATSFLAKPVNWRQLSYQIRYVVRTSSVPAVAKALVPASPDRDLLRSLKCIVEHLDAVTSEIPDGQWAHWQNEIRSARQVALQAIEALTSRPNPPIATTEVDHAKAS
jgi:CheY-like chemotaxis protein